MGRAYYISHNTTIHANREFWEVLGDKLGVNIDLSFSLVSKTKEHINGI